MPKSSFADYITQDLLSDLGRVEARAMFGGYGVYCEDRIFAIIVDDRLYFKVDDSNRKTFENAGSKPFSYLAKKKRVSLSYWEVPTEILEDRSEVLDWARASLRIPRCKRSASS